MFRQKCELDDINIENIVRWKGVARTGIQTVRYIGKDLVLFYLFLDMSDVADFFRNIKELISKCFTRFQHLTYVVYHEQHIKLYSVHPKSRDFKEFDVKIHTWGYLL